VRRRMLRVIRTSKTFVFLSFSPVGLHEIEGQLLLPFSLSEFFKPSNPEAGESRRSSDLREEKSQRLFD
jgi:hypothetical protein